MCIYYFSVCGQLLERKSPLDSTVISTDKLRKELVELCRLQGKSLKLLYRASRDGFAASSFHAKCDGQTKTLTVVQAAKSGYVFGGYAEMAWDSSGYSKTDPRAFLFSLTNGHGASQLMPVRSSGEMALFCDKSYGPSFGDDDLTISNESNVSSKTYSNLGVSYDLRMFEQGTTAAEAFLAGEQRFKTSEIEVFSVC